MARVSIAIRVLIGVDALKEPFIHGAIAVIVQAVADLRLLRIHSIVQIVAIKVICHPTGRGSAGDQRLAGIAIAIRVLIGIEALLQAIVEVAVALIVN